MNKKFIVVLLAFLFISLFINYILGSNYIALSKNQKI